MRNFATCSRSALSVASVIAMVVVVGALWWTKTIAFTKTAVVVFGTEQPADGSVRFTLIDVEASPDDLTTTTELLAQTHGGRASDYESDLTITSATDVSGLAVTARGHTPDAAPSLATEAAGLLSSHLTEINSTDHNPNGFIFTVTPAQQ